MAEVTIESQQPFVGYCTLNDGWELNSQTYRCHTIFCKRVRKPFTATYQTHFFFHYS